MAAERNMLQSRCFFGLLAVLAWVGSPGAVAAGGQAGPSLRDDYQREQTELPSRVIKQRDARLAQCQKIIAEFMSFDRFKSPTGWKVYGVDLRGRVWLFDQKVDGSCKLSKFARLERPDYSIDPDGARQWRTFYYENKQLCLYSRSGQSGNVRKICHDPVDGAARFAPYFLH